MHIDHFDDDDDGDDDGDNTNRRMQCLENVEY